MQIPFATRTLLRIGLVALMFAHCTPLVVGQPVTVPTVPGWDVVAWDKAPAVHAPPAGYELPDVRALMYDGPPYQGKPTRVFAWYGTPKLEPGEKAPAMVLVHGGGGTAYVEWVRRWNRQGYAAIAMDLRGALPPVDIVKARRHEFAGPDHSAVFAGIDAASQDQWPYHAVAGVILGHSLIRSFPEVDADRIGLTGISWGGFVACVTAGLDHRFKLAMPVYGCGFIADNSAWLDDFKKMGPERTERWVKWWDPSQYLGDADLPMLWLNGTNDFAYPPDSWQKSYRLGRGERQICLKLEMPHGHTGLAQESAEIFAFADWYLKGGTPLTKITGQGHVAVNVWAEYESASPIVKAELIHTHDQGDWQSFKYTTAPAIVDEAAHKITAELPAGARMYYLNLTDRKGLITSTEHVVLAEVAKP